VRLAVLDVGSNTVHLLVVDAYRGAPPLPAASVKTTLRLWEHLTAAGAISDEGTEALAAFVELALVEAENFGCESVMAFATSAIREATNTDEVLDSVKDRTGVALDVLTGEDEARLTFLAVRRWFGWSSGRLAVFDIGGGSLEIATGADEAPDLARTFALGAGRLTREWLDGDSATPDDIGALRRHIRAQIARDAGPLLRGGVGDHTVATSKTFRSLARVCGAAPSAEGPRVRRLLPHDVLQKKLPKLVTMSAAELANLPGVSAARAHQLLAGALVADAVMDLFEVQALEICPWALREGVILQRLDSL
jgi:exopolyphosphatase/guanosine-5'-triphosphate,3'-diphosphate pyrophosphatase